MKKNEITSLNSAIQILNDKNIEFGDRDDAAIDLAYYDDPLAENNLVERIMDVSEDEDIVDRCIESLYQIWERKKICNENISKQIPKKFLKIWHIYFPDKI